MGARAPQVLLVGRSVSGALCLVEHLRKWGSECHIATSYREACALLDAKGFDLVLSETRLPDGSAYRLISSLAGSVSSLFFSLPVEDSCWWLPAIVNGQQRWGAPALRPGEFAGALDAVLQERTSLAPVSPRAPADSLSAESVRIGALSAADVEKDPPEKHLAEAVRAAERHKSAT